MKRLTAVYFHYPYCIKKCPYCDFNSYGLDHKRAAPNGASRSIEDLEQEYVSALLADLSSQIERANLTSQICTSVFFGGGTPSLMSPGSVELILKRLFSLMQPSPEIEITLEANPGTIQETLGADKLRDFRSAGVNRISMGVQSFQPKKLKFLGRIHSANDSLEAVENIRSAGFENFNLDLMFGAAGETLDEWLSDLNSACLLEPQHISMYGLTIEPGTEFAVRSSRGAKLKVGEERESQMYRAGTELLADENYGRYEISNFAQPGKSCKHNLSYWTRREYLGVGAGAHGFIQTGAWGQRLYNAPAPHDYIKRINTSSDAVIRREDLSKEQAQIEFFMLNLRKAEGFEADDYSMLFGEEMPTAVQAVLDQLSNAGMIALQDEHVQLSQEGFLFADSVFEEIALSLESAGP